MLGKEKLYIFLDFDGVLNNAKTDFGRTYLSANNEIGWDNDNMLSTFQLINKLEEIYDVKVIISSAWKLNKTFDEFVAKLKQKKELIDRANIRVLAENLINKFVDKTPDWNHSEENHYSPKEIEIMGYLEKNNIVDEQILILDDEWIDIKYNNQLYWNIDSNFGMNDFDLEIILIELKRKLKKTGVANG